MAYGQNQPWGLKPARNLGSSTWNGQVSDGYLIASAYANNIFTGDLVYQGADGFIHNLSDLEVGDYPTFPALGVFWGCSFTTPTAVNPIDPANQGRTFWPAGTQTFNNAPAQAFIIDDPNIIFNIQTGQTGATQANCGSNVSVSYTYIDPSVTNPDGNTNTGNSFLVANMGTVGVAANLNLRIRRFVPVSENLPGIPFNNIEVLIQNHTFAQRSQGL